MKVILKKWGNSAAVPIPAAISAAHIGLDQVVDVREEQGRIFIEPVHRKVCKLDELLSGITLKNQHQRAVAGALVGKEV